MGLKTAIIGAGGHSAVLVDTLSVLGYDVDNIVFFAEVVDTNLMPKTNMVRRLSELFENTSLYGDKTIAIGDNLARSRIVEELALRKIQLVSVVHPSAYVSKLSSIGEATTVMAGCVVQPNTSIGKANILNTCSSIDHDCFLDDFVHVGPGARLTGNVKIGKRTFIGAGAVINPGIEIGDDVIVASGATVIKNVASGITVAGTPATRIN